MTIQQIISLITTNLTQQGSGDRIDSSELRAVINAITGELATRGIKIVPDTTALSALSGSDYTNAVVQNNGIYAYASTGTANGTTIFSANGGGVWVQKFSGANVTVGALGLLNTLSYTSNLLTNKPTLGALAALDTLDYAGNVLTNKPDLSTKQDTLMSGDTIKTINNVSLLGPGNLILGLAASIYFTVGENNYPQNGDAYYQSINLIGDYNWYDVYRNKQLQKVGDTVNGSVEIERESGKIYFHPSLSTGDEIVIELKRITALRPMSFKQFNVNLVSNLSAWYDATDPATITLGSGVITQINDKASGSKHLNNSSGPSYFTSGGSNDLPFIRFVAGKSIYQSTMSNENGIIVVYTVAKTVSNINGARLYSFRGNNGQNGLMSQQQSSSPYFGYSAYDGASTYPYDINGANGDWELIKAVFYGGGHFAITKNKLPIAVGLNEYINSLNYTANNIYRNYINLNADNSMSFDFSEMIVLNGLPSNVDDITIKNYLISKYQISLRKKILFFGDSHTQGVMSGVNAPGVRYSDKVSKDLGYDMMNYAVTGTVAWPYLTYAGLTYANLDQIFNIFDEHINGDLTICFQYGTNDGPTPQVNANWKINYKAYIQHFIDLGVNPRKIVICSPPYNTNSTYATHLSNTHAIIQQIASELGIKHADFYQGMINAGLDINAISGGDHIHGGQPEHTLMANILKAVIQAP